MQWIACLGRGAAAVAALVACAAPSLAQDSSTGREPDAGLAEVLDDISALRAAGLDEEARGALVGFLESGRLGALLRDDLQAVLDQLQVLEGAARSLGSAPALLRVREEIAVLLGERLAPDHPALVGALGNLAATRRAVGDLDGALALEERVLAAWEQTLPPDHPSLLVARQNLALTLKTLGREAEALELEQAVRAARVRALPFDHPDLLAIEGNLASTLHALGDLAGTRALLERVVAVQARLLPTDHPDRLADELRLAVVRHELGDGGARAAIERLHAALDGGLPSDHQAVLTAKELLAAVRHELGDLEGARELKEQVLAVRTATLPAEHPARLSAEENLALTLQLLGDLAGALELEEHVLAVRERQLPADHPDRLRVEGNLAVTCAALGDAAGALRLFEGAHDAWARLLPPEHPDLLRVRSNLAQVRKELGDLAGAVELEEQVYEARRRLLGPGHPSLLVTLQGLAETRIGLGELERARELVHELLDGLAVRAAMLRAEPPRAARAAAQVELGRLAATLRLAAALHDEALHARAFAVLEGLRLVSTPSIRAAVEAWRSSELAELRARLADARSALNDLGLTSPEDPAAVEPWRKRLVELAEARDRIERELRARLAARGPDEVVTAEAVARGLGPRGLYVGFLRYPRVLERDAAAGAAPSTVDSLLAFVVTPDATVRRVELGPCAELETLALRWRASLGEGTAPVVGTARGVAPGDPATQPGSGEAEAGRLLRERLLDPCLAAAGEAQAAVLHIVPDDFLHLVPLDALPSGKGQRLADVLALRTETSVERLLAPPPPAPGTGTLVALGGVDYGAAAVSAAPLDRGGPREGFAELAETRAEVEELAQRFTALFDGEPVVLTAQQATKHRLAELAPRARFLHVATHGWFAPETIRSTIDELERDRVELSAGLQRAEEAVRGFAPETLCGLALAGANRGADERGHVAGILTAEELAALDLSRCELAVLSACETSVGLRRAGQGIQSLQTALHAAGARTAITSLWKVDDAATRRLMELFYAALWSDGLGKADALWQAKAALRQEGHPPRDWAGWVLTGEPD